MSRKFNGTSDFAQASVDLSTYSLITVSFWMWWDTNAFNDSYALEHTANFNANNGWVIAPNNAPTPGTWIFGMGTATGGTKSWLDQITTRPTAAAWHHFMLVMNRATPVNTAWVGGVSAPLSTVVHQAGTYGNYANSTLNCMARNGTTKFSPGRLAELAIWGGVGLTTAHAKALAAGALPFQARPDNLVFYTPLLGADSPEPEYSGGKHSATLTGTSFSPHPAVTAGFFPKRGFQPMPV